SYIVMDSPPEHGSLAPFVDITRRLRAAGLHAPRIFRENRREGFLLLEDLGDELYRDLLDEHSVDALFGEAFDAMLVMAHETDRSGLPEYDEDLLFDEMYWFVDVYLNRHRGTVLKHAQRQSWGRLCETVVNTTMEQPRAFVHKDLHSCNLLKTRRNSPGIIDYQDAMVGPVTYDLVSLLWDRYIRWPRARLEGWMEQFRQQACPEATPEQWLRWCDLMSLQRNIKIVGRFAILEHVEDKPGYVEMIPRFYQYIQDVLALYPEFSDVAEWLGEPECAP
ncbi:MAG: phosphotransferase, partial [Xanthomonadales bacterium]|nr:phosphotransferase [Xanthomonadales bacterium]